MKAPKKKTTKAQELPVTVVPEAVAAHADKVDKCRDALKAFPSLPEGYVCAKGIYFVKEMAEAALANGEELIIVTLEK